MAILQGHERAFSYDMEFQFSRFEIVTGTGALFLCLVFVCVFMEAGAIQTQLATAALDSIGHDDLYWVSVEGRGQELLLEGAAADDEARRRAAERAGAVPGVTALGNHITVVGDAGVCQKPVDDYLHDRQVTFKAGTAELSPSAPQILAALTRILGSCAAAFEVAVHTDAKGDSAVNATLSQRRAEAVVRYLVQSGVEPDRLRPVGYGERQPIADNASKAGRAANRRVEFRVLGAT